jgi:CBS-domain-containing membrane protein
MQRRDMGVVHRERRDLEAVDIDAVNELLQHTIENVPIINAAARGIAGIVSNSGSKKNFRTLIFTLYPYIFM